MELPHAVPMELPWLNYSPNGTSSLCWLSYNSYLQVSPCYYWLAVHRWGGVSVIPLASLTVSLCPWSSISQTTCLMTGSLIFLPFSPVSLLCLFRAPLSVRQQFSQQFSLRLPLVLLHGFLFHDELAKPD